jgi:YebC/PmpR family DNA-binding regulatory protein
MSGHSKWSTIKHKKAAKDAKKGKLFTKFIKEITVAARMGGGDLNSNPRLRTAVLTARANSMPNDNIDRAIKKGTGELGGAVYEQVTYEGYGPGGVALLIEGTTDNANRTVAEIRHLFSRHGGNLGASNSVAWMFDRKGQLALDASRYDEDTALEDALEAGAQDFTRDGEQFIVSTTPPELHSVQDALRRKGYTIESAELAMVARSTVRVEGAEAQRVIRLLDALEELDDVSKVFSNFDIDAKTLAEAEA